MDTSVHIIVLFEKEEMEKRLLGTMNLDNEVAESLYQRLLGYAGKRLPKQEFIETLRKAIEKTITECSLKGVDANLLRNMHTTELVNVMVNASGATISELITAIDLSGFVPDTSLEDDMVTPPA